MGDARLELVPVGDVVVPVLALGVRRGPPAVLLPGLTDALAPVTDPRTQALLGQVPVPMARFQGLVLSHRVPTGPAVTTRALAHDVAGLLRRRLDRPALVIAHSMGTMVAQHLAIDHPELVGALVLSAATAYADPQLRAVLARWETLVRARDGAALARAAVQASFTPPALDEHLALIAAAPPPDPDAAQVARHLALSAAAVGHDSRSGLGRIGVPTLVLAAGADPVVAPACSWELARAVTGARYVRLDGLAHGFPEQAPDRYAAAVLPFLADHGW